MSRITDVYLKRLFKVIHNYVISNHPNTEIGDLFDDTSTYEDISIFIQDKLSHSDADEVDFIYASFSLNWEMYASSFPEIYGEVIRPKLTRYEGVRNYYAKVVYDEYYHHNTYLPIMLEYLINDYQIDEDNIESEIYDTWDYSVTIHEKK